MTAVTGLGAAIACIGSSYLLAQVFAGRSEAQIRQFVSQQLAVSFSLASVLAIALVVIWDVIVRLLPNLGYIPRNGLTLSAIGMIPATLWAIALDVLTLDGRAKTFAAIVIAQSLLSTGALFISLFLLDAGTLALFISGLTGSLILGVGGGLSLLRYFERPYFGKDGLSLFRNAVSVAGANIVEAIYQPIERNVLAASSGLAVLGLYTHAQQYRSLVAMATKAMGRSVWPVTLSEATQSHLSFSETSRYWRGTHVVLAIVGLGFAAVGDELIGILTHGKFAGAGPYAAAGIAYLILQNSGKPHTGFMYAHGHVGPYARFSIMATVAGLGCAILFIPIFGAWGALLSVCLQQIILRVAIQLYVARIQPIPFQDGWLLAGLVLMLPLVVLHVLFRPQLSVKVAYAVLAGLALVSACVVASRRNGG